MLKLYKLVNGKLHYWETWDKDNKTAIVHWGAVGQRGQDKEITSKPFSGFRKSVQQEINEMLKNGYAEFDENKIAILEVEFLIHGFGTEQDLEKRYDLQDRLNELLGGTGLGHVDGGSSGSGTMEVCCMVVDFEIAKKTIKQDLKNTEFSDYSQIKRGE